MNNSYQQQFIDMYMKKCYNSYFLNNMYPMNYTQMLETNNNTGFLRLNILNQVDKEPIPYATIIIYVTDGTRRDIPIMHMITTINPISIELPLANILGTQIAGPEYDFSTYNIRVDAFGHISNNIYNIRLFPNMTTDVVFELMPITQLRQQPVIEETETIQTNDNDGFLRVNILNRVTREPIPYATVIIYVTDGARRDIPVMHIITTINPVRVELPMANVLGTQIVGPEYDFSTYNIRVDAFGYISNNIYNIRLFPNVTTDFNIELMPVTQLRQQPIIEERLEIPPHLRDITNNL